MGSCCGAISVGTGLAQLGSPFAGAYPKWVDAACRFEQPGGHHGWRRIAPVLRRLCNERALILAANLQCQGQLLSFWSTIRRVGSLPASIDIFQYGRTGLSKYPRSFDRTSRNRVMYDREVAAPRLLATFSDEHVGCLCR